MPAVQARHRWQFLTIQRIITDAELPSNLSHDLTTVADLQSAAAIPRIHPIRCSHNWFSDLIGIALA